MLFLLSSVLFSCKTRELLPLPSVIATVNTYEYVVQNMDEEAKCDNSTLTAFYNGFNVSYYLNNMKMTFVIENKTNKYLIIDKSKCYVLYNGYSKELFKDVRAGRTTTYNNVQDAISSVNTNESSVTLSIPPYSKWELPIEESNIQAVERFYNFKWEVGDHSLTQYTTNQTIEFVIPYSWDYALAKWSTSRNRLFVGNINVNERVFANPNVAMYSQQNNRICYTSVKISSEGRKEYDSVCRINDEIREKNSNAELKNELFKIFGLAFGIPAGIGLLAGLILPLVL